MSAIEWTDETWNPVTGCDRVSPGCAHCYALDLAARLKGMGQARYQRDGDPRTSGPGFGVTLHEDRLDEPLRWRRPRRVFVNSMSDLFHERLTGLPAIRRRSGTFEAIPDSEQPKLDDEPPRPDFIADVFAVMSIATQHTFQVLTKRPEAMMLLLTHPNFWLQVNAARLERGVSVLPGGMSEYASTNGKALPNVWLGTSIENRQFVHRARTLRMTPAAVRFISAEPLLGPLTGLGDELAPEAKRVPPPDQHIDEALAWDRAERARPKLPGIDWLIVGGESGPEHRPMKLEWVRDLRDACLADRCTLCNGRSSTCWSCTGERTDAPAFFFKQWGGRTPKAGGRELEGRTWDEFPEPAREAVPA